VKKNVLSYSLAKLTTYVFGLSREGRSTSLHERTCDSASRKQSSSLSLHDNVLYPHGETAKIPVHPADVRAFHSTRTVLMCNARFTPVTDVKE
jgi:hypothetical protein